jgi:hypothetical protein
MLGVGTTVIDRRATASLSFADWKPGFINYRELDNWGTITFSHGALYVGSLIVNHHLFNLNTEPDRTGAPSGLLQGGKPGAPTPRLSYKN